MSDGRQVLTTAPAKRGAAYRDAIAVLALALVTCSTANAQLGPVDTRGYVEYRYLYRAGSDRDGVGAHGAAVRTDFSTFVWRPWILSARGSLLLQEYGSDSTEGLATSSIVQGGLWLDFLARSKFPLTIFYEDFNADLDNVKYRRTARTRSHGFRQNLTSRRLGAYSLEYRRSMTDSLYADGFTLPTINDTTRWDFKGNKVIGRNRFALNSRNIEINAQEPDVRTDSVRHTLRHDFRAGSRFNLQNTFFVTDEQFERDLVQTGRIYKQLYSLATWRPDEANRWVVTGRGLFQDNESASVVGGPGRSSASLSGTASYRATDRISLTGALSVARMQSDLGDESTSSYQQLGVNYASLGYPLWGGTYRFGGRGAIGNRTESDDSITEDTRELRFNVGHSLHRPFETSSGKRIDFRGAQNITSTSDSSGRELSTLRSSLHVTAGVSEQQWSRYMRFALTDQRSTGDEEHNYQLVDLQYNLQGSLTRDRSWNLNASVQYGLRKQTKPPDLVNDSQSLSYRVGVAYRHMNLFDVSFLNFSSDFQFQSEDFQSEDPFDDELGIERERVNSSWRNRLEYRVGLLHLRSDLGLHEVDGRWSAAFRFTARRYFGM